jgi:tRNA-dihydrouridine synthase A
MATGAAAGFDPAEHPVALQLGGSDPRPPWPGGADRRGRIWLRRDQPQRRLSVGPGAERPLRRLPDARAGAGGRVHGRDRRGGARPGDGQVPDRRRRPGSGNQLFGLVDRLRRRRASACSSSTPARPGWKGLSPKQNRDVPPLDYPLVWRLKRERPGLTIVINGGDRLAGARRGASGMGRRGDAGPRRLS